MRRSTFLGDGEAASSMVSPYLPCLSLLPQIRMNNKANSNYRRQEKKRVKKENAAAAKSNDDDGQLLSSSSSLTQCQVNLEKELQQ